MGVGWVSDNMDLTKVAFEVSFEIEVRFVSPCFEGYLGTSLLNKNYHRYKGLSA